MKERVRAHALTLFDVVGFTSPAPPGHSAFVEAWLEAGFHGEMAYLEKRNALRSGPLNRPELLAEAKTVIVIAQSYAPPLPPSSLGTRVSSEGGQGGCGTSAPGGCGTVARYARGEDYHTVLWGKLNQLAAWLAETFPGTQSRGFTDSGPIRERELAARAGLGWQGKHTNLISLSLGNWFFLGALLTTLELEPDAPFEGQHCGRCTRCLAACPTGALVAPMALDARRCISYLTIELKGRIPEELRPLMGERIFGCDDCLAACPWNDKAQTGHESRLAARDTDAAHPDLLALLALLETEEAFKAKFQGTPILRPGRAGLRRNVCVALGNVGGPEALPALEHVAATDPSEVVREHAAWAIGRIESGG